MQTTVSASYADRYPGLIVFSDMHEIDTGVVEDSAGIAPGLIVAKGTADKGIKVPTAATDLTGTGARGAVLYEATREGGTAGDFLQKESAPVLNWGATFVPALAGTYTIGSAVNVYYTAPNQGKIAASPVASNTAVHAYAEIAETVTLSSPGSVKVRFKR